MVTVAAGALLGWAFSGTLTSIFTGMTVWGAVMFGASLGSLVGGFIAQRNISDYDNSPTYSFGPISNTMSQLVPIPVI